jgi:hypothetical protein
MKPGEVILLVSEDLAQTSHVGLMRTDCNAADTAKPSYSHPPLGEAAKVPAEYP